MADKQTSALTAAATLDGTELVHVVQGGNSRKSTTQEIADLGGGGTSRLVNLGTMRPLTDFTQVEITGTRSVVDTSGKALTIKETSMSGSIVLYGLRRALPSTTSRVAVFVQPNLSVRKYQSLAFGFSDGTKYQVLCLHGSNSTAGTYVESQDWSNSTTRVTNTGLASASTVQNNTGLWIGLRVDASNGKAYWEISSDGVNFATLNWTAISTGYLASYTNAFVGIFSAATEIVAGTDYPCSLSILDWDESGLSRTFA